MTNQQWQLFLIAESYPNRETYMDNDWNNITTPFHGSYSNEQSLGILRYCRNNCIR